LRRCGKWTKIFAGTGNFPTPASTYAAAPAATTCLKKEYTQDGQVVFADVCTNGSVAAPAGQQVQAAPQQHYFGIETQRTRAPAGVLHFRIG
jgi:hypothetical protein